MTTLESAKSFKLANLRKNVTTFLQLNYDWKVSKAISTGEAVSDQDKRFRESIVNEYNNRVVKVNAATTILEVNQISTVF
ncbi:MAG: hypothetical protein JSS76_18965 [Bacteroidetes bacterium]|nr:hypothetical protein [Bacteroidota bacterium]